MNEIDLEIIYIIREKNYNTYRYRFIAVGHLKRPKKLFICFFFL